MTIIGKLRNILSQRINAGRGAILDLARRLARDQVDASQGSAQLDRTMTDATVADRVEEVESLAAIVKRYDELVELSDRLPDAEQRLLAARRREDKATSEWESKCKARREEAILLHNASLDLEHEVRSLQHSQAERHEIELEHGDLVEAKPVNLDEYTLLGCGVVINVCDPHAKPFAVTPKVFQRETARRNRIYQRAMQEVIDNHRRAMDGWLTSLRRRFDGSPIDDGKKPQFADVSWRELVASGRCDELAR